MKMKHNSEKKNKCKSESCDQKVTLKEITNMVDELVSFILAQRRI